MTKLEEKSGDGANRGEISYPITQSEIEHLAKGHKQGRINISVSDQKTLESLYMVLATRPLNQEEHDTFIAIENKFDEYLYGITMRKTYGPGFRFED